MSIQKDFINVCFYQLCKRGVLILLWLPQHCISVVFRVCFFFYHRVKMAYQRCLQLFLWAFNGFIYLLYLSLGNVPSRWQRIYLPMLEMQEMRVQSLGLEEPLELAMAAHSSILVWKNPMDRGAWRATVHGVEKSDWATNVFAGWCKVDFCITHYLGLICVQNLFRMLSRKSWSCVWRPVLRKTATLVCDSQFMCVYG